MVYALCFLPNVRRSGTRDIRYYAIRKLLEGPAIMWSRMFVIDVSIHIIENRNDELKYSRNQTKKKRHKFHIKVISQFSLSASNSYAFFSHHIIVYFDFSYN